MNLKELLSDSLEGLIDAVIQYFRALWFVLSRPRRGPRVAAALYRTKNLPPPVVFAAVSLLLALLVFLGAGSLDSDSILATLSSFSKSDSGNFFLFASLTLYVLLLCRLFSSQFRTRRRRDFVNKVFLIASSSFVLELVALLALFDRLVVIWFPDDGLPPNGVMLASLAALLLPFGPLLYQADRAYLSRKLEGPIRRIALGSGFAILAFAVFSMCGALYAFAVYRMAAATYEKADKAFETIVKFIDCKVEVRTIQYVVHIFNDTKTAVLVRSVSATLRNDVDGKAFDFEIPISASGRTALPNYDFLVVRPNDVVSFAGAQLLPVGLAASDPYLSCAGTLKRHTGFELADEIAFYGRYGRTGFH